MFLIVIASIYREKPRGSGNHPVIRKHTSPTKDHPDKNVQSNKNEKAWIKS